MARGALSSGNEDSLPDGISRIVRVIIGSNDDGFLVPSSVIAALSEEQRKPEELDISDFTRDELSNLLRKSIDELSLLELTRDERIALLGGDLPDDLVRSLPIHNLGHGVGAIGDYCFWEDQWPIPERLHNVVQRVVLFNDPTARLRQADIVGEWSPLKQIMVALDQNDAYQYQEEILDALSRLVQDADGDAVPRALLKRLREEAWLVHSKIPIAPEKLLALPRKVDDAVPDEIRAQYSSVNGLPERVRDDPRFRDFQRHLIMDRESSVGKLADLINAAGLKGRLGDHVHYPISAFTNLAKQDVDLQLPGWGLLAALLVAGMDDREVVSSFHAVSYEDPEMAAAHLSAIAKRIGSMSVDRRSEVECAYAHGFKAVAAWSYEVRCRVFANTLVPTVAECWRSGSEVIAEGEGVAHSHLLSGQYRALLRDLDG